MDVKLVIPEKVTEPISFGEVSGKLFRNILSNNTGECSIHPPYVIMISEPGERLVQCES